MRWRDERPNLGLCIFLTIMIVLVFSVFYQGAKSRHVAAALADQPSTLAKRGIEMKPGYRVELHRLPNGVPCAVLTGGPDQAAITCGWDAKPVRK